MYKETITYNDYNDKERSEDFYFDLSQAELIEIEMTTVGGFVAMVDNAIKAQDYPTLYRVFKDFVSRSYGVKSADGREFEKSDTILRRFTQTRAYSNLMTRLCTDAEYASKFINGIVGAAAPSTPNTIIPTQATN